MKNTLTSEQHDEIVESILSDDRLIGIDAGYVDNGFEIFKALPADVAFACGLVGVEATEAALTAWMDAEYGRALAAIARPRERGKKMENEIRLTNGTETFLLCRVTFDETGPVHGLDSRGSGYSKCDTATCDHEHAPDGATVWHDDENTEELWVAAQ